MGNEKQNPQMDWQQVILNGGPPCFAQLDDEAGWYCGRARGWEGHDGEHKFVSLNDLLATVRAEEREAALKAVRELYHKSEVSDSRWNAAITHAESAIERLNRKGEG